MASPVLPLLPWLVTFLVIDHRLSQPPSFYRSILLQCPGIAHPGTTGCARFTSDNRRYRRPHAGYLLGEDFPIGGNSHTPLERDAEAFRAAATCGVF